MLTLNIFVHGYLVNILESHMDERIMIQSTLFAVAFGVSRKGILWYRIS